MKILRPIGAIVAWAIISSIVGYVVSLALNWISGAFNISTTFGSVVFLIVTMPIVASINWWLCLMIGLWFVQTKKQALIVLIVCGLWQILTLLSSLKSITMWVVTATTLFAFSIIYIGKLGEENNG
jgi:hypothetical protein